MRRARVEGELRRREQERLLGREELQTKQDPSGPQRGLSFSLVTATIVVALTGLVGTVVGAYLQGRT